MHTLTKVGIIVLVIGIIIAGIGLYSTFTVAGSLTSVIELKNAQAITLNPSSSYNISYSVTKTPAIVMLALNSSKPISVTVPTTFSRLSQNNEIVYEMVLTTPQTGTITLYNNYTVPITVEYQLGQATPSLLSALVLPGGFLAIIGIILAIIGVIMGRRKS